VTDPDKRSPGHAVPPANPPMRNGADGASAERTRLAWRRTALTTTAVALLTVRVAVRHGYGPLAIVGIAAAAIGWLAQLVVAQHRIKAMDTPRPGNIGRTLPAFAAVIMGFVVLSIVLTTA
jgi:uncharacterized membrane protein YidH (DUF202 family)